MSKYNKGDRVQLTKLCVNPAIQVGDIGIIIQQSDDSLQWVHWFRSKVNQVVTTDKLNIINETAIELALFDQVKSLQEQINWINEKLANFDNHKHEIPGTNPYVHELTGLPESEDE